MTSRPLPRRARHPHLLVAVVLGVVAVHLWVVDQRLWRRPGQPAVQPAMATRTTLDAATTPPDMPPPAPPVATPSRAARPVLPEAPAQQVPAQQDASATAAAPVPVAAGTPPLPFRLPPSQTLQFQAQQGSQSTTAVLRWQQDGDHYDLTLDAPGLIHLHSEGRVDAFGLAPERHTERRPPRSERALSMPRGAEGQANAVLYSTRSTPGTWTPGLQDRLSWLVQLQAWLTTLPPGAHARDWPLQVTGVGGDVQQWLLQPQAGDEPDDAGLLRYRQTPAQPYDSRVEAWFDTQPPHWPARLRLGAYRGEVLELRRLPANAGSISDGIRR
ncbi:MAG: hypothetical protein ABI574_08150 [Burkholderiales bacterium]